MKLPPEFGRCNIKTVVTSLGNKSQQPSRNPDNFYFMLDAHYRSGLTMSGGDLGFLQPALWKECRIRGAAGIAGSLRGPCRAFFSAPYGCVGRNERPQHLLGERLMHLRRARQSGFTMIEAALAIALTAVAGSAILLGVTASIDATAESVNKSLACGMAQQLVDEIVGARYGADGTGAYQTGLGPNSWEASGMGRERFNDIDDFNGVNSQPPEDLNGVALGTDDGQGSTRHASFQAPANYFSRWRQKVEVYYVNASDFSQRLTGNNTSDYRCVDVKIDYNDPIRGWQTLAQERRVVTYIQAP